jgi:hypothetical protein
MTNPTPRPALRKAEDASVHPAAPRPARSPRASTAKAAAPIESVAEPVVGPAPVEAVVPKPGKKKRKFGGATSDHLRVEDSPAADTKPVAARPSKTKAKASTRDDLMQGKAVDLDVAVPKALRKAAAKRARSEGLDLQTVVIDALHAYVTRPPR